MDSDKVLVVDAGTVVEFDSPQNLLKNKYGFFYNLVHQTNKSTSGSLRTMVAKVPKYKKHSLVLALLFIAVLLILFYLYNNL